VRRVVKETKGGEKEVKIHVERKIDAAHLLPDYDGPCRRLHGHSWKVIVELDGDINPETGMVIDFREIKKIIDALDHRYLNDFIGYPSAENLVNYFIDRFLALKLQNIEKVLVRVYESEDCFVEEVFIAK